MRSRAAAFDASARMAASSAGCSAASGGARHRPHSETMILLVPDERLRRPARPVRLPDLAVEHLVDRLVAELLGAPAVGVAAQQVGGSVAVAVVQDQGSELVLANPRITRRNGSQAGWEACLSVPHLVGWVERPLEVTVEADDLQGRRHRHQATGLMARALVHEVEHLEGRLYLDDLSPERLVDTREHPTPPPMPGARHP